MIYYSTVERVHGKLSRKIKLRTDRMYDIPIGCSWPHTIVRCGIWLIILAFRSRLWVNYVSYLALLLRAAALNIAELLTIIWTASGCVPGALKVD